MKTFSIGIVVAFLFSSAVVAQDGDASDSSFASLCHEADGPCQDLKRAAVAVGNALGHEGNSFTDPNTVSCYAKDAPCNIAKREALAMAEAVAEAYSVAFPDDSRSSSKAALHARDSQAEIPTIAGREPRWYTWCFRRGAACGKKREETPDLSQWCKEIGGHCTEGVEKVMEASDMVARAEDPEKRWYTWCFRHGAACAKLKRATQYLTEFLKE